MHLDESLGRVEGLLGLNRVGGAKDGMAGGEAGEKKDGDGEMEDDDDDDDDERDVGIEKVNIPSLEITPSSRNGNSLTPPDSKLITRIANEYTQLTYLVNQARGESCAYVDEIEEVSL